MSGNIRYPHWSILVLSAAVLAGGYFVYELSVEEAPGSTTLSWTPPAESEDNKPLQNLAGYNIHCWGDAGRYTNTVHIEDPSTTQYVITDLAPGVYQCAVSAFTTDGVESALSNVVARRVR